MKIKTRTPISKPAIGWRQLCAIARDQIASDPTIDNFEWAERIKLRLVRLGFDYPRPPHRMTDAMDAVERALVKVWGPRPVLLPPAISTQTREVIPPQLDPPWPKRSCQPQGWTSVQRLASRKPRGDGSTSSSEASVKVTRPLTLRQLEVRKAARILAQGILEQVQRCEAAEHAVEDQKS